MKLNSRRLLLGSVCAIAVLSTGNILKAEKKEDKKPELAILSPKADDKVDSLEAVSIATTVPGKPLVLVRADIPGSFWWAQQPATVLNRFQYLSSTRIGNDKTPVGTPFKLVAVLIKDVKDLEQCPPGAPLEEIPEDLARSSEIRVLYQPAAGKVSKKDVILEPKDNGVVSRIGMLTGRITTKGWPVVLIRSTEPGSMWWAQEPVEMTDDNHFRLLARFGNARTPDGSKFEVVFLVTQKPEVFKPGNAIPKLPEDITRSPSIEVVFERLRRR